MHTGDWIAVAAVVLAAVALLCVLALTVRLRRTTAEVRRLADAVGRVDGDVLHSSADRSQSAGPTPPGAPADPHDGVVVEIEPIGPTGQDAVVVTSDGRTIVLPTNAQVVSATMSRPMVRGAVLGHGVLHALRPESRDRIVSLVRREVRSRRKARLRAGRAATRPPHDPSGSRRHADDDRRGVRP